MQFTSGYGSFVARAHLTPAKARALFAAGHRHVLLQVDFQGSELPQRTPAQIAAETAVAHAAGLAVDWWMWVRPRDRMGAGRRPGGVEAMHRRLVELQTAGLQPPPLFVADCEVDGGWDRTRPALAQVAGAARTAGMSRVGLSTHAFVGARWPVSAFDVGLPQLYRKLPVTPEWALRMLKSWRGCKEFWPTLGCADDSDAAEMAADVAALDTLGCYGATWWTARQLNGAKLAASVPGGRP